MPESESTPSNETIVPSSDLPANTPQERSVAKNASLSAVGTLGSRVLGAVRDMVIARTFSLGATDAFTVAFTIPNALRGLLAEGAVSAALVPTYQKLRTLEGDKSANQFASLLLGRLLLFSLIASVVGILFAPQILSFYAEGYAGRGDDTWLETILLTRWLMPYIALMSVAAMHAGLLNVHGVFALPSFAPTAFNVAQIAACLLPAAIAQMVGLPPIGMLALGALGGGILHIATQVPALRKKNLPILPRLDAKNPHVTSALKKLAPLAFGLGVYQLNVLFSRRFASFLEVGAQSYLYYGQRLVEIPQGMFAVALASATLPLLSLLHAQNDREGLKTAFLVSVRQVLFVAFPCVALLAGLSLPIASMLFVGAHFSFHDAGETARSLDIQSLGVLPIALVRVLVPLFHSSGDTRTPIWASAANLVVFFLLGMYLPHYLGHVGIAVASAVAALLQVGVLFWLAQGRMLNLSWKEALQFWSGFLRLCVAGLVTYGTASLVASFGQWNLGVASLRNWAILAVAGGLSVGIFLMSSQLLRIAEARWLVAIVQKKLRR